MRIGWDSGPADLDTVARFRRLFDRDRLGAPAPREVLDDLALAVSEIGANAVLHAARKPERLEIAVFADGPALRVEMRDDGSPFEDFARLWEAGRSAPLDPMAEGGRGLWLVRNSVDRLVYDASDGNRWSFSRSFARGERPSILLVEDDIATRAYLAGVLARIAQVSHAASLAEARAMLEDARFDLVVADFNLEDGNLAQWLDGRAVDPAQGDLPFIFVTADTSGAARSSALRHGVHTVIEKPVRPRELLARAAEAIAAHRAHSIRASARLAREIEQKIALDVAASFGRFTLVARGAAASIGGGDAFSDLGAVGGRRRFSLADCAGHGVPARLQAAMLGGLTAGLSPLSDTPDAFLENVSAAIGRGGVLDSLVATILVMDLCGDGGVELATAGHPSPLLLGRDGAMRPLELEGALPGLLPRCGARARRVELAEGERLLLATDGVAPDSASVLSGIPRAVERVIAGLGAMPIASAADALQSALVDELGAYPADDWTFVLVEASQPAER